MAAAHELTKGQLKKTIRNVTSKRKAAKVKPKTYIANPFDHDWPKVPQCDARLIRNEVERVISSLNLAKPKQSELRLTAKNQKERNEEKKLLKRTLWQKQCEYREHYILGFNNVIRLLERDQLSAVLVCADTSPAFMTHPLIPLCSSRAIPAVSIHNLGTTLARAFNLKSCRILGLKKSTTEPGNAFHSIYCLIRDKAPILPSCIENFKEIKMLDTEHTPQTPKTQEETPKEHTVQDFSHLYILKKDVKTAAPKAADFIALDTISFTTVSHKRQHDNDEDEEECITEANGTCAPEIYKSISMKRVHPSGKQKKRRRKRK